MAAPKGNQFWLNRTTHGRDKIFATPAIMWEAACEYFQWCIDNPLMETDFRGKDANEVEIPHMRPFTLIGVAHYCDVNEQYFRDFADSLKGKTDEISKDFSLVVARIRETIYNQKFEGAAAGFLNPSIIARDLNLREKSDLTTDGKELRPGVTVIVKDAAAKTDIEKEL